MMQAKEAANISVCYQHKVWKTINTVRLILSTIQKQFAQLNTTDESG